MARARVVAADYYAFLTLLRRATDENKRIDPGTPAWAAYIKSHSINEVAATAIARQTFEKPVGVILDLGLDSDGLYFHSRDDEACLRLVTVG